MSLRFGPVRRITPRATYRSVYRNDAWIGSAVREGHWWVAALPDPYGTFIAGEDGNVRRWRLREGPVLALALVAEGLPQ